VKKKRGRGRGWAKKIKKKIRQNGGNATQHGRPDLCCRWGERGNNEPKGGGSLAVIEVRPPQSCVGKRKKKKTGQ